MICAGMAGFLFEVTFEVTRKEDPAMVSQSRIFLMVSMKLLFLMM